jgi:hypothetical protein
LQPAGFRSDGLRANQGDAGMAAGSDRKGAIDMQGIRRAGLTALPLAALAFIIVGSPSPGAAQAVEQFYKGKLLDLEIGYPTGGSNDAYGRLIANHLG